MKYNLHTFNAEVDYYTKKLKNKLIAVTVVKQSDLVITGVVEYWKPVLI